MKVLRGGLFRVEDLDFADAKTREKHGRRRRFRQIISGMPTAKLRARLLSMATEAGISVIAVDPAYTSKWGAQDWQKHFGCHPHTNHPSPRRERGDRTARPRAPDPATDGTAPTTPE